MTTVAPPVPISRRRRARRQRGARFVGRKRRLPSGRRDDCSSSRSARQGGHHRGGADAAVGRFRDIQLEAHQDRATTDLDSQREPLLPKHIERECLLARPPAGDQRGLHIRTACDGVQGQRNEPPRDQQLTGGVENRLTRHAAAACLTTRGRGVIGRQLVGHDGCAAPRRRWRRVKRAHGLGLSDQDSAEIEIQPLRREKPRRLILVDVRSWCIKSVRFAAASPGLGADHAIGEREHHEFRSSTQL